MKKFLVLLIALFMVLPFMPVLAQEDTVVSRLEEYNANLPQSYGLISVEDLNARLIEENVFLLDVRQPEEYAAGHIEGSVSIPLRELAKNLDLLPGLDAEIVVICKGGWRAMIGGVSLQILGYENTKVLKGGFDAWVAAELPAVTEPTLVEAQALPTLDPILLDAVDTFLSNLPENWASIKATDLAAELVDNPPVLLDVRSTDEWNSGYIAGAQHLWVNEFMASRDQWPQDKDASIVVYCASGYRGGVVFVILNLMGYSNVRNLSGGLNAWMVAELPVEGAPAETATFDMQAHLTSYLATLPNSFNAIQASDVKTKMDAGGNFVLVDVRTLDEYAEGYLAGAINIPLQELTRRLDLLPDVEADIIVYCGSGHRSTLAMMALNLLGYTKAQSMLGGMNAWLKAEYPTTTAPVTYTGGVAPQFDPVLFATVDSFITAIPQGYYAVKAADLNTELVENPPFLIDVRTDSEWANGHIEGAVHLPLRDFMTLLSQLPTDKTMPIVTYDSGSHRGAMAMMLLRLMGYENVRSLGGGTGAWTAAELPLVQ